ncbi:MAG: DedA family protein [Aquificota bacterium]|nr:MAG: DedA family protein [Aquificota bacterium]RLD98021.1 MAG: DedA family protein [Aquificota bacterium]
MLHQVVMWIVKTMGSLGYPGILVLMFLESSFFPFPSEVVIPPAGYLASKGEMNILLVILCGTLGSLLGALFNYWISLALGRPFFQRYGKYFLVSDKTLSRVDLFFDRHGHISTLIGRLLPGIRQYISLPAGMARMNIPLFILFTSLGAGLWVMVLALVGYLVGHNQELLKLYLNKTVWAMVILSILLALVYLVWHRKRSKKA